MGRRKSRKIIVLPIIVVIVAAAFYFYSDKIIDFSSKIPEQVASQEASKTIEEIKEKIPDVDKTIDQIKDKTSEISESIKESIPKEAPQIPVVTKPEIQIPKLEAKIHDLINVERQNHGLSTLVWDQTIANIARTHSQDMVNRDYFSHDSPEDIGPDMRGKAYGYNECGDLATIELSKKYERMLRQYEAAGSSNQAMYNQLQQMYQQLNSATSRGMIFGGLSENIAQNNLYDSVWYTNGVPTSYDWNDSDDLANSIVQQWMNSPGHRQNILTPYYHSEGIGVAISSDDKVYATENFC